MRTVSFSNRQLQQLLNNDFVSVYTNTYGDPTAGQSIKHSPNDSPGPCIRGNGKQNVQSIFMTPDREIFHVATGYQSADDLMEESKFALALFNKMKSKPSNQKREIVISEHRSRLSQPQTNQRSPVAEFSNLTNRFTNTSNVGRGAPINRNRTEMRFPGMEMMGMMIGQNTNQDQQFSINHPLLTFEELERDPTRLVGSGNSFFASSGFGTDAFGK